MFSWEILPEYDVAVYMDANLRVLGDIAPLVRQFVESQAPLALIRHPDRSDIRQEAERCIELKKVRPEEVAILRRQVDSYIAEGLPENHVLTENNVIFFRHGHPLLAGIMRDWWHEFRSHAKRDQISLPYVLWKNGVVPLYWDWNVRAPNPYFAIHRHRGGTLQNIETRLYIKRCENPLWRYPHGAFSRLRRLIR
jgi:hypothetical protein